MTAKPTKPASTRARPPKGKTRPRRPNHDEIAERAYFIYLEDGTSDELANWLRAEREFAVSR